MYNQTTQVKSVSIWSIEVFALWFIISIGNLITYFSPIGDRTSYLEIGVLLVFFVFCLPIILGITAVVRRLARVPGTNKKSHDLECHMIVASQGLITFGVLAGLLCSKWGSIVMILIAGQYSMMMYSRYRTGDIRYWAH